jgi:hypothetical protein
MTELNAQEVARKFMAENFQVNDLEGTIIRAIEQHFPKTVLRDSHNEQVVVRFLSYVLKFVSQHVKNVQGQAIVGSVYGILNLYGVAGTLAIVRKMQKVAKKQKENHVANSSTV